MSERPWLTVVVPVPQGSDDRLEAASQLREELGAGVEVLALVEHAASVPASPNGVRVLATDDVAATSWTVGAALADTALVVLLAPGTPVQASLVRRLLDAREPGARVVEVADASAQGRAAALLGRPRSAARLVDGGATGEARHWLGLPARSLHWSRRTVTLLALLLYGLAVGIGGAVAASDQQLPELLSTRTAQLQQAIRFVDSGGPLLAAQAPDGSYQAVPIADDPGYYVVVPLVGAVANDDDPALVLQWVHLGMLALCGALYAPLALVLFRSLLAALAAPWVAVLAFGDLVTFDFYAASAFAVALTLPVLTALHVRWGRHSLALLLAVVVVASGFSALRSHAGLPVLAVALGLVALHAPRWGRRLRWAALVVCAYLVVQPLTLHALEEHRNRQLGQPTLGEGYVHAHGLWHALYVGFGFQPNDRGLRWDDSVPDELARAQDPPITFATDEYFRFLRGEVLDLVADDPGFVIHTVALKTALATRDGLDRYVLGLLLAVALALVGAQRRVLRTALVVAAPFALLGLANPVVALPLEDYELGWLGSLAAVQVLAVIALVALLPTLVREAPRARTHARRARAELMGLRRRSWAVAVGVVVLGAALVLAGRPLAADAADLLPYTMAVESRPAASLSGDVVQRDDFSGGVPASWTSDGAIATPGTSGTAVETTPARSAYQLEGPGFTLPAGRHALVVDADVLDGGMQAGLLDVERDAWIDGAIGGYAWSSRRGKPDERLVLPFELTEPREVRVVLSNWAHDDERSRWALRSVELREDVDGG